MEPYSIRPRPLRITALLVAQIEALEADDARRIEALHRAARFTGSPTFRLAVSHLKQAGRAGDWQQAQDAIWDAVRARALPKRVRYAAYDAALALLTRDLLDPQAFRELYGAWAGARDEHVLSLD